MERTPEQILDENESLKETIRAWFEVKGLAQSQLEPQFMKAVRGYLRTSRNGGMPQKQSNIVDANMENFARLYLAQTMWPLLLRIAEEHREALVVPESVKPKPGITDDRLLEAITQCLDETPKMPVAVSDMDDHERKFFDIIAKQSGMLLFLQQMLAERLRDA
jgi:hypothetical protein